VKKPKDNRILARVVARELTKEEMRTVSGGSGGGSCSWGGGMCTQRPNPPFAPEEDFVEVSDD
jgi:hypothetical protein